jgi:hypothetical protein
MLLVQDLIYLFGLCWKGFSKTIQFFCDYWGPTSLGTRLHPEALEGTVIVSYYIRGDDARKHPMAALWTKYGRGKLEDMNETYTIGMAWAMTFEAALKIALKEVGYKKLDGEVIYQTYQKLTGVQRAGLQVRVPIARPHAGEAGKSDFIR